MFGDLDGMCNSLLFFFPLVYLAFRQIKSGYVSVMFMFLVNTYNIYIYIYKSTGTKVLFWSSMLKDVNQKKKKKKIMSYLGVYG